MPKHNRAVYSEEFFARQADISQHSADVIVPELLSLFPVTSVADVGCGVGTWLEAFRRCGITDLLGIDGDYVDLDTFRVGREHFVVADLAKGIPRTRTLDLAVCVEVAEHLPESHAANFVADLCWLAPLVLFSAAIPGQCGTHHINEQWQSYWAGIFRLNGFIAVDIFGRRFWNCRDVSAEYAQNMVIYASRLGREHEEVEVLDVLHPHYWNNIGLKRIASSLPNALSMAWSKRFG